MGVGEKLVALFHLSQLLMRHQSLPLQRLREGQWRARGICGTTVGAQEEEEEGGNKPCVCGNGGSRGLWGGWFVCNQCSRQQPSQSNGSQTICDRKGSIYIDKVDSKSGCHFLWQQQMNPSQPRMHFTPLRRNLHKCHQTQFGCDHWSSEANVTTRKTWTL